MEQGVEQPTSGGLRVAKPCLQAIAERHESIDPGDDAVLFSEGWYQDHMVQERPPIDVFHHQAMSVIAFSQGTKRALRRRSRKFRHVVCRETVESGVTSGMSCRTCLRRQLYVAPKSGSAGNSPLRMAEASSMPIQPSIIEA